MVPLSFGTTTMPAHQGVGVSTLDIMPSDSILFNSFRTCTRGVVSSQAEMPRSYVVHTTSGPLRRNSQHLRPVPEERTAPEEPIPEDGQPPRENTTFSSQSCNDATEIWH